MKFIVIQPQPSLRVDEPDRGDYKTIVEKETERILKQQACEAERALGNLEYTSMFVNTVGDAIIRGDLSSPKGAKWGMVITRQDYELLKRLFECEPYVARYLEEGKFKEALGCDPPDPLMFHGNQIQLRIAEAAMRIAESLERKEKATTGPRDPNTGTIGKRREELVSRRIESCGCCYDDVRIADPCERHREMFKMPAKEGRK